MCSCVCVCVRKREKEKKEIKVIKDEKSVNLGFFFKCLFVRVSGEKELFFTAEKVKEKKKDFQLIFFIFLHLKRKISTNIRNFVVLLAFVRSRHGIHLCYFLGYFFLFEIQLFYFIFKTFKKKFT